MQKFSDANTLIRRDKAYISTYIEDFVSQRIILCVFMRRISI